MEEPSVSTAAMELTNNRILKASIEKIMGKNPALLEMTAITSSMNAVAQHWHDDVVPMGSAVQSARSFAPAYTMFVMLQNTTKSMGATCVCPGTHMCSGGRLAQVCEEHGFQVVGEEGYYRAGDLLLMNMNSWHRGAAFNDPSAPDRVMLILTWVPRPRSNAESRQIPHGITYSLRWDMWGLTWNDLTKGAASMSQPWTILRALGLYKERSADWGIDYVSSASMRMANSQIGFQEIDLINFVNRDGGLKFLPSWLHGCVGNGEEASWKEFLRDTLRQCKRFALILSFCLFGASMLLSMQLEGHVREARRPQRWIMLRPTSGFLTIVFAVYKMGIEHVDNSQWATDLKHGMLYTSPFGNAESLYDGPTVLPHRNDVLIQTRYKSDYMALYNDFVGNHPGNFVWNGLVERVSPAYMVYGGHTSCLSEAVAQWIVKTIQDSGGRFLYQRDADWVEIPKEHAITQTKEELVIKANTVRERVLTELDYLLSEAKYGRFRKSVIHTYSLLQLQVLRTKLLDTASRSESLPYELVVRVENSTKRHLYQRLPIIELAKSIQQMHRHPVLLPAMAQKSPVEPEPDSWLKTGDIIDVAEEEYDVLYWYKAQIEHVSSLGRFHVHYLGCSGTAIVVRSYVRRYIPPAVGDVVEVEVDEDEYKEGIIVGKKAGNLFDVKVDGDVMRNRNDETFRRND